VKRSLNYRPQLNVLEDRITPVAPSRMPVEVPETFLIEDACPFPVELTFLTNKEVATTFYDRDGNVVRTLTTGALKVRATNLETGKSIDLNISGPGVSYPDGTSINRGSWFYWYPPGNPQGQPTGIIVVHGRSAWSPTSFEVLSGRVEDICAALEGPAE
jgi:hypothetical protein